MSDGLELFRAEALSIEALLADLYNLVLQEGPLRLDGSIPLRDAEGNVIDIYSVSIIPTDDYPKSFPLVYETAGRLPHNIDWHIYPDGHFCIKAYPEEVVICVAGLSLITFIQEQLVPYLFNQNFREKYGYFLKERSHGTEGNLEFFKDVFKTENLLEIKRHLQFILKRQTPNRVELCFCGSGIKYRKCHRAAYQLVSKLPDNIISAYIKTISLST